MTPFKPSQHGFPFSNYWPPGMPVIEVTTPFGIVPIGDAQKGVCGGMIFTAADLYHAGRPVPQVAVKPVFKYFCKRLFDSFNLPFGMLKYYDWQRRPLASRAWAGVAMIDGTANLTRRVEWPRIREALDAGRLVPIGLVKVQTFNPLRLGENHQVLAYGYEVNGDNAVIRIYDPNYPGDDGAALTFNLAVEEPIVHSCEGPSVRGVFLTDYTPCDPADLNCLHDTNGTV